MSQEVDLTCYVPCYNEEENVANTLNKIKAVMSTQKLSYEALVFDDCSKDRTGDVVRDFMAKNPDMNIRLIQNKFNRGMGYNYIEGAYLGRGKYYMLVNGDNAETAFCMSKIVSQIGKADIIIPYYDNEDGRSWFRSNLSRIYTKLVNLLSGHNIRYYNGPTVHLRKNSMRWHPQSCGHGYQAELLSAVLETGASYLEVQVPNDEQKGSITSALRLVNMMSLTHSLSQIFLRRVRRTIWPVS